jgi:hypothetical protein
MQLANATELDRNPGYRSGEICGFAFTPFAQRFFYLLRAATTSKGRIISLSSCSRMWQCHT